MIISRTISRAMTRDNIGGIFLRMHIARNLGTVPDASMPCGLSASTNPPDEFNCANHSLRLRMILLSTNQNISQDDRGFNMGKPKDERETWAQTEFLPLKEMILPHQQEHQDSALSDFTSGFPCFSNNLTLES